MHLTAKSGKCNSIHGWDVSPSSIAATKRTLETIDDNLAYELTCQDLFDAQGFSEV